MARNDTNCCFCPPPPAPPAPGQKLVDDLLSYTVVAALPVASFILTAMSVQYFLSCVFRRLWLFPCYPAQFMALTAGPLAIVGLCAKPLSSDDSHLGSLLRSLLPCAMVGACMPSIAVMDRRQMWSNVAGTAVLLMACIFNLVNYRNYISPSDHISPSEAFESFYKYGIPIWGSAAACLMVASLVLIVQAVTLDVMMRDVATCVLIRLEQLGNYSMQDAKLVNNGHLVPANNNWSFEDLERKTCIKLMMALTSNSQNVASRSPMSSVVILAALCPILFIAITPYLPGVISLLKLHFIFISVSLIGLGFMCISRWVRLAIYDQRSLPAILFHTHPFYWPRHKVSHYWLHVLKSGPPCPLLNPSNIWQRSTYVFKLIVHSILASTILYSIILILQICLVAARIIDFLFTLIFRALKPPLLLLLRLLILLPLKVLLFCIAWMLKRCCMGPPGPAQESVPAPHLDLSPGVVYIAGENPLTVQKLFEPCARHSIRTQAKQAEAKSIKALQTLLKLSNQACFLTNNVVYEVLHPRAMSDVGLLDETSQQRNQIYGWSLTIISLLTVMNRVEVEAFGTCKKSTAATEAYKQAMKMVEVVDSMHAPKVCSIEVYLQASTSTWVSLLKACRSWQTTARHVRGVNDPIDILDVMLDFARKQIRLANNRNHVLPWIVEEVKAYTMYTVCYNLRKWLMDMKNDAERDKDVLQGGDDCLIINHIQFLVAEVLTVCLVSLPTILEITTDTATCSGDVAKIENAIFLILQAKKIWKELQWPSIVHNTDLGNVVASANFSLNEYWLQPNMSTSAHTDAISASSSYKRKSSVYERHSWPRQNARGYCNM